MATVEVSANGKFDLSFINLNNLFGGLDYVEKPKRFEVKFEGGDKVQFNGTGFKYKADGTPKAKGEISSIVVFDNGKQAYSIEKLTLKVADVIDVARTQSVADDIALIAGVFSGNDAFVGGKRGDHFLGLDGNDKFKGNGGNDTIEGGAGNDTLNGGTGADKMYGGTGNDKFYVNNKHDKVYESTGGGGSDKVYASHSYKLGSSAEIELLQTVSRSGKANINLTGNKFDQKIDGNAGKNVIDGKGGNDELQGFKGHDTFIFSTALGTGNVDTIKGYVVGEDKIHLDQDIFTGLALGKLSNGDFTDHFIYDTHGNLSFDQDGVGTGAAAEQFAVMASHNGSHPALAAADFLVV